MRTAARKSLRRGGSQSVEPDSTETTDAAVDQRKRGSGSRDQRPRTKRWRFSEPTERKRQSQTSDHDLPSLTSQQFECHVFNSLVLEAPPGVEPGVDVCGATPVVFARSEALATPLEVPRAQSNTIYARCSSCVALAEVARRWFAAGTVRAQLMRFRTVRNVEVSWQRDQDYALRARTAGRSAGVGRRNALAGTVTTATVLPVISKNSTEYPSSATLGTT